MTDFDAHCQQIANEAVGRMLVQSNLDQLQ